MAGSIFPYPGVCMLGNIYTDQRCPICGGKFVDMGPKYGFRCPSHKDVYPNRVRAAIDGHFKRFSGPGCYDQAQQWLAGIRAKIGDPITHGQYDPRDYDRKKPLSFSVLSNQFLNKKAKAVSKSQLRNLTNYLKHAKEAWGDCNIKDIGYAEIEDFLDSLDVSSKTRANYRSGIHSFFTWACKRYSKGAHKIEMPDFPEGSFELGYRKITDKVTQIKVFEQIKEDRAKEPRIWLAIKWLITYASLRPDDIRRIREENIDRRTGRIIIERPTKRKKSRQIMLIPEDLEFLNTLARGLPHMPLFRHDWDKAIQTKAGDPLGMNILNKVWKTACKKLGIEGVTLYAGTRHTTVTALQEHISPDQIKQFTQHETNQAFERYLFPDQVKQIEMATLSSPTPKRSNVIKIKKPRE